MCCAAVGARRVLVAALVLTGGVLTGCSSPSSTQGPGATSAPRTGVFPVTLEHRFGTTTVPAPPRRVVTIGDEDVAIAVGVTPVGMARYQNSASGLAPHLEGRVDLARTVLIDVPAGAEGEGAAGVNVEQVAALAPDLILAVNDFGLAEDYPRLSRLAPTVGYATVWGAQPWQEQALVGARALGLEERGREAVARTEAAIRATREANPGLVGRSVTFSYAYEPGKIVTLKSAADPAVKLLEDLGMRIPPAVAGLPDIAAGNPGGDLSFEQISLLDADIVIMLYANEALRRQVEAFGLFTNLPAVRDGRYLVLDLPTISALRTPTVLSIPWALDRIRPELARVAR